MSINQTGAIAGWYDNKKGVFGFVRSADGSITEFDADGHHQTYAVAINSSGTIAGYAHNSGFVRDAGGNVTLFHSPAGTTYPIQALGINDAGTVTGCWFDSQKIAHGFLRAAGGDFTSFDVPGKGGTAQATCPVSINASGDVTGSYGNSFGTHGFVRTSAGKFARFEVNPATMPLSINAGGDVTGYWQDVNGLNHAFVRTANGTLTSFCGNDVDVSCISYSINDAGVTTGFSGARERGFLRMSDGTESSFDVRGQVPTPVSINDSNSVTGYYPGKGTNAFAFHGFVLTQ